MTNRTSSASISRYRGAHDRSVPDRLLSGALHLSGDLLPWSPVHVRASDGRRRESIGERLRSTGYNRMVVSMHTIQDHDRIFGALGDPTRRDIVRRAIDAEEGVAELAQHYPMSFAAVQKHVAILERAGLVSKHRVGRRRVVRTNLEGLRVARRLLDRYEELWRERVERMNQLISESPKEADR